MIKFWSYKKEYKKFRGEILKNIDITLSRGVTFFGNEIKKFEKNFLKKYNSKYGVAVGSGTEALLISLKALDIKKGDEIITAANTAIPTISAIVNSGAKPKLVDIGEDYLIDCTKIEREINKKTKAIIPVHLYGQSCDMGKISSLAKRYNLKVIEDCAQSQGAKYKNRYTGTMGDFGCFSFYPTKILGAYGDGGFIITKNYYDYLKVKRLRYYGIETENKKNIYFNKYYANENGVNSRLDEIQSTILNIKLKHVDEFISKRIKLANIYFRELKKTNLKLPYQNKLNKHVFHLFTVYHPQKPKILSLLKKYNLQTRIIYPYPINTMKGYKMYSFDKKKLKISLKKSKGIFSLPLYPELEISEIKKICKILKKVLSKIN
tara:strand:+ start:693 stop:1823 length:1131 start_codon:yes stop_codon:yes gene_type:complete